MKVYMLSEGGSLSGWVETTEALAPAYLAAAGYTDTPPPESIPEGHGAIMGPEGWTTAPDHRGMAWISPGGEVFVATEVGQTGPDGWTPMAFSRLGGNAP